MSSRANFIKNNPLPGSSSLLCEARGLEELKKNQSLHGLNIPEVISLTTDSLELQKIDSIAPTQNHWSRLATGLAKLHEIPSEHFGFESANYIGLKPQLNHLTDNWGEFFIHYRLKYQIDLIENENLKNELGENLLKHKSKLCDFLTAHNPEPRLVHGDLWSGNIMFSAQGPWLIDPAVYYGDPEVDIAMTKLFGGFDHEFYNTYNKLNPTSAGSSEREIIYNLYHYLNHYNIFGSSYLSAVHEGFSELCSL